MTKFLSFLLLVAVISTVLPSFASADPEGPYGWECLEEFILPSGLDTSDPWYAVPGDTIQIPILFKSADGLPTNWDKMHKWDGLGLWFHFRQDAEENNLQVLDVSLGSGLDPDDYTLTYYQDPMDYTTYYDDYDYDYDVFSSTYVNIIGDGQGLSCVGTDEAEVAIFTIKIKDAFYSSFTDAQGYVPIDVSMSKTGDYAYQHRMKVCASNDNWPITTFWPAYPYGCTFNGTILVDCSAKRGTTATDDASWSTVKALY